MATATPQTEPEAYVDSDMLYEVIDGQIVEKVMGSYASLAGTNSAPPAPFTTVEKGNGSPACSPTRSTCDSSLAPLCRAPVPGHWPGRILHSTMRRFLPELSTAPRAGR